MTDDLITIVGAEFGDDATVALPILMSYGDGAYDFEPDRVRRALVTLADGDLERLRHFCARAHEDFRDVLMWAEHPRKADEPSKYTELRNRLQPSPDTDRE